MFTVQSKEENGSKNTVSTMTEASPERAEDPVRLDKEVKEAQLSRVEANVNADEHRKALASTKAVADGGLMVTIVPTSPTKRIQPASGSLLGIIHDKD